MVIAPTNLPPAILATLNESCVAALRRPEVVERHRTLGAEVRTSTPEEIRAFVQAEMDKWLDTARKAGIQPQGAH
jgi:tripartite-type tricarboxylate transporter receptor subunit TctC